MYAAQLMAGMKKELNVDELIENGNLGPIQKFSFKVLCENPSRNQKIFTTISLAWIIFIGYLTWWNGLKSLALDKSFKWDEWFWFGIIPATVPYLFYFIWKKKD